MSFDSESKPVNESQNVKQNLVPAKSPNYAGSGRGRFHGENGDAFWRLSFGVDSVEENTSKVVRSVWYKSDDELDVPPPSCRNCGSNARRSIETDTTRKFSKVTEGKLRGIPADKEIMTEIHLCNREKATISKTPRTDIAIEKKSKRKCQGAKKKWPKLDKNTDIAKEEWTNSVHNNISEQASATAIDGEKWKTKGVSSRRCCSLSSMNTQKNNQTATAEDCGFAARNLDNTQKSEKWSAEWQRLKAKKIEEIKLKSKQQRKSLYISKEFQRRTTKQSSKVRIFSPRTASKIEICKIKALEDMKKAKLKTKVTEEITTKTRARLGRFAMVKCSSDPQKDFRDSMIEMIMEKKINQPQELEELLACYLALNSDEYHDLIIKVFWQVWLDLSQACFDCEVENNNVPKVNYYFTSLK